MRRLACVDVPELPLQLLIRAHADWQGLPTVVVDHDHPQGVVQWVNDAARGFGILPGLRFATALGLCADLRAGAVPASEVQLGVRAVHELLATFSPAVEVLSEEPGVFWLDASGLHHLYPSLARWARELHQALHARQGLYATVVVGFSRFATYAAAKSRRTSAPAPRREPVLLFDDPHDEQRAAYAVALVELDLEPSARDALAKLGVHTLRDLVRLPAAGLRERFGERVYLLHRLASGSAWDRFSPTLIEEPPSESIVFDYRETDVTRLVFVIKARLHALLGALAERHQALVALTITLRLDDRTQREEQVRPATPTLDAAQLLELVRLRLEAAPLPAAVVELALRAESIAATAEQVRLFAEHPRRDLAAAARALARLRAELGEGAVSRLALRDAHLPEAQYTWEPLDRLVLPRPLSAAVRPLVRRFHARAVPLRPRSRHERDDGWLVKGLEAGPVTRVLGPYVVSGAWWRREVHRAYHFLQLQNGELLWVYYDRERRRWFLQGEVD